MNSIITRDLRAGGRNPTNFVSDAVMQMSVDAPIPNDDGIPTPYSFARMPASFSMSCVRRLLTVLMLLSLGSPRLAFAQEVSATLGVTRTMKSTILNEDRKVLVHLPASYDTSGNAYPVLYLLDGTQAFLLEMIAITTRLRNDRNAPEMIIVAIENTNRNRDMMPVVAKDFPGPPRAEAFLGFLEKELIPDIEKTYRTAQPRILQGKSLERPVHCLRAARETNRVQCVRRVQRRLVRGKQRVLPGTEHSSVSKGGIVCKQASLHGELPPRPIRP